MPPRLLWYMQGVVSEDRFLDNLRERTRLPSGLAPGSKAEEGVTPTRMPSTPIIALLHSDSHDDSSHTIDKAATKAVKERLEDVLGRHQVRPQQP